MPNIMRADELVPGLTARFEDFTFSIKRVSNLTDNWVLVVPQTGVPMHLENYAEVEIIHIPGWVQREYLDD